VCLLTRIKKYAYQVKLYYVKSAGSFDWLFIFSVKAKRTAKKNLEKTWNEGRVEEGGIKWAAKGLEAFPAPQPREQCLLRIFKPRNLYMRVLGTYSTSDLVIRPWNAPKCSFDLTEKHK